MKGLRWLLTAALAVSTATQAYSIEGKVVGISDGDTLTANKIDTSVMFARLPWTGPTSTPIWARPVMPGSTASTTGAMTCRRSRRKPRQRPRVCGDNPRRKLLSPRNGGKAKKKYSCRYSKRNRKRAARQKRPSAPISAVAAASVTVARCVLAPRRNTTTVNAGSAVSTGTRMVFRVKSSAAIEAQRLPTLHSAPTTPNPNRRLAGGFCLRRKAAVLYSNSTVGELKTQQSRRECTASSVTSNSSVIRQRHPCDGVTTQSGSHAAVIIQPAGERPCLGRSRVFFCPNLAKAILPPC